MRPIKMKMKKRRKRTSKGVGRTRLVAQYKSYGALCGEGKRLFEEEGLDVDIIMPGEAGSDQLVASGKSEFGVSYQESVTEARVQDVPIVSLAAVIQHNTSGFASLKEKNITSPKDFEGKTYGGWGAPLEKAVLASLMEVSGADIEKVDIVNMGEADFLPLCKEMLISLGFIMHGREWKRSFAGKK